MTKLPAFLQSRLALGQNETGSHPSADVLAAFAERTLPSGERAGVVEHLARCAACRDILAAASAPAVDAARAPGIAWWKWRWAAGVAAACLIAVLFWRTTPPAPAPPLAPPLAPKAQALRIAEPARHPAAKKPPAKKRIVPARKTPEQPIAAAKPKPELPQIVLTPPRISMDQFYQAASSPKPIQHSEDRAQLERPAMLFQSGMRAGLTKELVRTRRGNTLWRLDGTLQKSGDGGKTWRTVPVGGGARLYALSTRGPNVWVGGADGALFHSVNDGLDWNPITISDRDARLTETITRIDARDEYRIKLTTRSGDWLTTDGGVHWRRE